MKDKVYEEKLRTIRAVKELRGCLDRLERVMSISEDDPAIRDAYREFKNEVRAM